MIVANMAGENILSRLSKEQIITFICKIQIYIEQSLISKIQYFFALFDTLFKPISKLPFASQKFISFLPGVTKRGTRCGAPLLYSISQTPKDQFPH